MSVSLPLPPLMTSLPPSPQITSSPSVPMRMSSPSVPTIVQPARAGSAGTGGGGGGGEITIHVYDAALRSVFPAMSIALARNTCRDQCIEIQTESSARCKPRTVRCRGCTRSVEPSSEEEITNSAVVDFGHQSSGVDANVVSGAVLSIPTAEAVTVADHGRPQRRRTRRRLSSSAERAWGSAAIVSPSSHRPDLERDRGRRHVMPTVTSVGGGVRGCFPGSIRQSVVRPVSHRLSGCCHRNWM